MTGDELGDWLKQELDEVEVKSAVFDLGGTQDSQNLDKLPFVAFIRALFVALI